MASTTEKHASAREDLLAAAQALYAQNGVAATTPRQVMARSGVGQGSLYHHFPSKKDLAIAAVTRTAEQTLEAARDVLEADADPHDRVTAYVGRDRDAVAGCRVGRLTADPLVMDDESLREPVRGYFTGLIELVTDVFVEDGLDGEAARDRAMTSVAVVQGGYVLSRALGDEEPMRRAVRGFLELLEVER